MDNDLKSQLIVLTGPSAAGKDEVRTHLLESNSDMRRVVTATTRPKRDYEIEGVHYFFKTSAEFVELESRNKLLEVTPYNGYLYGAPIEALNPILTGTSLIWVLGMSSASKVEEMLQQTLEFHQAEELLRRMLLITIGVPRLTVLKDRLKMRGDSKSDITSRLKKDWQMWCEEEVRLENIVINHQGKFKETMLHVNALIHEHKEYLTRKIK